MSMLKAELLTVRGSVYAVAFLAGLAASVTTTAYGQTTTAQELVLKAAEKYGPEFKDIEAAVAAFRKGSIAECRHLLEKAKQEHSELAPPDVMLSLLYLAAGNREEAENTLDATAAKESVDPEAFLIVAELALRDRHRLLAAIAFRRALELADKFDSASSPKRAANFQVRIHAGLAAVDEGRKQYDAAIEHLNAWVKLEPKNPIPQGSLGRVNFLSGKPDEALAAFEKLRVIEPDAPPPEIALGRLYSDAGDNAKALEMMTTAANKYGDDTRACLTVAEWALKNGKLDLAQSNIDAALNIEKDSAGALILSARLARHQQKADVAERILSELVLRVPDNFPASNEYALVLANSGDTAKRTTALQYARRNYQQLQQLVRNRPTMQLGEAVMTLAWAFYQNGQYAEAESALNALPSGVVISSENAYYTAKIYAERGRKDPARGALKAALTQGVDFPGIDDAKKLMETLGDK